MPKVSGRKRAILNGESCRDSSYMIVKLWYCLPLHSLSYFISHHDTSSSTYYEDIYFVELNIPPLEYCFLLKLPISCNIMKCATIWELTHHNDPSQSWLWLIPHLFDFTASDFLEELYDFLNQCYSRSFRFDSHDCYTADISMRWTGLRLQVSKLKVRGSPQDARICREWSRMIQQFKKHLKDSE